MSSFFNLAANVVQVRLSVRVQIGLKDGLPDRYIGLAWIVKSSPVRRAPSLGWRVTRWVARVELGLQVV